MKMKRIVTTFLVGAMLTLTLGAVTGCGESDEDVIRNALTSELDSIKNLDGAYMNELYAGLDAEDLAEYGLNAEDFMNNYLDGFDYSIDSVTVDGDNASAVVTLTCKSYKAWEAALETATNDALATTDFTAMTETELMEFVGNLMMTTLSDVAVAPTSPITIEYEKQDNTWVPTSSSETAISSAMLSN